MLLQHDDFLYSMVSDGVRIERYVGTSTSIVVPSTIGEFPVVHWDSGVLDGCSFVTEITFPASIHKIDGEVSRFNDHFIVDFCYIKRFNVVADSYAYHYLMYYRAKDRLYELPAEPSQPHYIVAQLDATFDDHGVLVIHGVLNGNANTLVIPAVWQGGTVTAVAIKVPLFNIRAMTIAAPLQRIETSYFPTLHELFIEVDNEFFYTDGQALFNKERTQLIALYDEKLHHYDVPDGVTTIAPYACCSLKQLQRVSIPQTVRTIGRAAFATCFQLAEIVGGDSVQQCGHEVFDYTAWLKNADCAVFANALLKYRITDNEVRLPATFDTIHPYAFEWYNAVDERTAFLQLVVIPEGVRVIAEDAFSSLEIVKLQLPSTVEQVGMNNVSSYELTADNPFFSTHEGVLYNKERTEIVHFIRDNTLQSYRVLDGVINLPADAFYNCTRLTDVYLPDSLCTIGEEAFRFCRLLQSIRLPASLREIGEGAFKDCYRLTTIVTPPSLQTIGVEAFYYCRSLREVKLNEGLQTIGSEAFAYTSLEQIELPTSVTQLGENCFCSTRHIISYNTQQQIHYSKPFGKFFTQYITFKDRPSGQVQYEVCLFSTRSNAYCEALDRAWCDDGTYNFVKMDESFTLVESVMEQIEVAKWRLENNYNLLPTYRDQYARTLEKHAITVLKKYIFDGNADKIVKMSSYGFITAANIQSLIEFAQEEKELNVFMFLLDYKNRISDDTTFSNYDEFDL